MSDRLLRAVFYPLGFPVEIATNAREVIVAASESWGNWEQLFDEPPLSFVVEVHEGQTAPATPAFSAGEDGFHYASDAANRGYFRSLLCAGRLRISLETLRRREWFGDRPAARPGVD